MKDQVVQQDGHATPRVHRAVAHAAEDRYILNMHAIHNAHLIRKALPRQLSQPIPYLSEAERAAKHAEYAAVAHDVQITKRTEATLKAQATRARNKATKELDSTMAGAELTLRDG